MNAILRLWGWECILLGSLSQSQRFNEPIKCPLTTIPLKYVVKNSTEPYAMVVQIKLAHDMRLFLHFKTLPSFPVLLEKEVNDNFTLNSA